MVESTSDLILKMKEMNSAIISLLLELNVCTTRGKIGDLIVEPSQKGYEGGFKLWERYQEENFTVVTDGGKTISLISPHGKIKLNSQCVEKTVNMEGGYPKITLGWAGEVDKKINVGGLIRVGVDISPISSIVCIANGDGSFNTGIQGDHSELSACRLPERLDKEKVILGLEIKKVIDFGAEAEKIIKDSKLIELLNALSAMEGAKK